jgi:hypothetical protein
VRFLTSRLPSVPPASDDELLTLIRTLDSSQFTERQTASQRLEVLGRAAEPALRQALAQQPTLEQRRRIESLLEALPSGYSRLQGDSLRAARAVAILEGINTREARRALAKWAAGSAGALITQEAKASLDRLARRSEALP